MIGIARDRAHMAAVHVPGGLLFGAGLTYQQVARKAGNIGYRADVEIAVAAALVLTWINLAVGLIGTLEESSKSLLL